MKAYAFDVDETLEVSEGPVKVNDLIELFNQGHIIGLCGNWAVFCHAVPGWHALISFIGPMEMPKDAFLRQLRVFLPVEEVVMVGNIQGVSGASDDAGAAERAEVRFISEKAFAEGER